MEFNVGDLVVIKQICGKWAGSEWKPRKQEPAFCIVEKIVDTPPHIGDIDCNILVKCKGLTGEAGSTPSCWVSKKQCKLVMRAGCLTALLEDVPDEEE